jgi:trehalose-phosphatase
MSDVQAVVLAGGLGTRLRAVTQDLLPKPLVPVAGEPFLLHQLRMLAKHGIRDALLLVGHRSEAILEFVRSRPVPGLQLTVSTEPAPLGTAGALRHAAEKIGRIFLLLYGDSFLDTDYRAGVQAFERSAAQALLFAFDDKDGVTDVLPNLAVSESGAILRYEKDSAAPDLSLIDAGALILRKEVLDVIPPGVSSFESDILPRLISSRQAIAQRISERFYDVGTPRRLREFELFQKSQGSQPSTNVDAIVRWAETARHPLLLLDYDGTLRAFASHPDLARPDESLRALLMRLAEHASVHILSGRKRSDLELFLGDLPVSLHAEHGALSRQWPNPAWHVRAPIEPPWMKVAMAALEVAGTSEGAFIEKKETCLTWHYRKAEQGENLAKRVRVRLKKDLANEPVEVLCGSKIVEVRPRGVHKGVQTQELIGTADAVLAAGDDRSDEDTFSAVREKGVTIRVGPGATVAEYRVPDVESVRRLLERLSESFPRR